MTEYGGADSLVNTSTYELSTFDKSLMEYTEKVFEGFDKTDPEVINDMYHYMGKINAAEITMSKCEEAGVTPSPRRDYGHHTFSWGDLNPKSPQNRYDELAGKNQGGVPSSIGPITGTFNKAVGYGLHDLNEIPYKIAYDFSDEKVDFNDKYDIMNQTKKQMAEMDIDTSSINYNVNAGTTGQMYKSTLEKATHGVESYSNYGAGHTHHGTGRMYAEEIAEKGNIDETGNSISEGTARLVKMLHQGIVPGTENEMTSDAFVAFSEEQRQELGIPLDPSYETIGTMKEAEFGTSTAPQPEEPEATAAVGMGLN